MPTKTTSGEVAPSEKIEIHRIIAKETYGGFIRGMSYTYRENGYSEAHKSVIYIIIDDLGKINSITEDYVREHFDFY